MKMMLEQTRLLDKMMELAADEEFELEVAVKILEANATK